MFEKQQNKMASQFPPHFRIHREGWRRKHCYLSPSNGPILYAVSLHSGWSGKPHLVLHNGPNENCPPLATSKIKTSVFNNGDAIVTLLPSPGSTGSAVQEQVEYHGSSFGHKTMFFSVEVGATGRRETFEWRHSSGAEVGALGGCGDGYKLVRLATDAPGALRQRGGATSSDGKEIVAVWAAQSRRLSTGFNFQFLGTGSSGVLGEKWAAMAVMSALRGWDRILRQRAQTAAAAS
ncbi:hypothetical protein M406DRAFT_358241 [Cryphonectria parasitica EP155]|uniref:Uncharacterized protein n=1 Tax=Cryphonectria parasitica (strain ATCC 38755 / EP155) TaxID=660469 RepID=A0A9P4XTG8_CRYP1|nr:uncharacterized protein M406DRAFT_358241 [Cryphonectria parasitica EP155]KAF3760591.1 hypothetical protein M406DRAFT_358241 [Cryphonectria parasitica EP155]